MQASPIFIKTFDAVIWILEHTKKFPKHQRFVLAQRIEQAVLSFQDEITWAAKSKSPQEALARADYHLQRLHIYSRICLKMQFLSFGQYEHLSTMLSELGRLLGGWLKKHK